MSGKDEETHGLIRYDASISEVNAVEDEALQMLQNECHRKELSSITEIQCYLTKYSTTSSVFADQSIANPDYQKTLYCISCILQAELFDDLSEAARVPPSLNPELNVETTLPPHLGGLQPKIPEDIMMRETADDPELRVELLAGTVPTVDTILRFISWLHQSAKYSAQCNIIAFIYIKRMMDSKCVLTMRNWRGMWLGAIILAQKVWDDSSLRTSSFASILPGVTKSQLKALELKIFQLLNYATSVKPSIYARFYFELREIFKSITGEGTGKEAQAPGGRIGRIRPLTMKNADILKGNVEDPRNAPISNSAKKASSPRTSSRKTTSLPPTSPTQMGTLKDPATEGSQAQRSAKAATLQVSTSTSGITKLPPIATPPARSTGSFGASKSIDDGAGTRKNSEDDNLKDNSLLKYISAASTPCITNTKSKQHRSSSKRSSGKQAPMTLEDFTYTKSSIFVIS